jgi:hypothetical protein
MQLGYEQEDQVPLSPGYQANKPTSSWIPDWLKEDIDTHRRDSVNTSRKRQDLEQEEIDQGFPSGPTTGGPMEKERFFERKAMQPSAQDQRPVTDEPAVRGLGEALAPRGDGWDDASTATGMRREKDQWDAAMEWEQYKRDLASDFFDDVGRAATSEEINDMLEYRTKGRFDDDMTLASPSGDYMGY